MHRTSSCVIYIPCAFTRPLCFLYAVFFVEETLITMLAVWMPENKSRHTHARFTTDIHIRHHTHINEHTRVLCVYAPLLYLLYERYTFCIQLRFFLTNEIVIMSRPAESSTQKQHHNTTHRHSRSLVALCVFAAFSCRFVTLLEACASRCVAENVVYAKPNTRQAKSIHRALAVDCVVLYSIYYRMYMV